MGNPGVGIPPQRETDVSPSHSVRAPTRILMQPGLAAASPHPKRAIFRPTKTTKQQLLRPISVPLTTPL